MSSLVGAAVAGLTLWLGATSAGASQPESAAAQSTVQAGDAEASSAAVAQVAAWVTATADNQDLPFVIIDKVGARVFVFEADGTLRGSGPALLGAARGDTSAPGVGQRELWSIPPQEKTTPAGRFVAAFGRAYGGKSVLWVDYRDAISLHPVVTTNPKEHRLKRLASPSVQDNRITFGCINVGAAFYRKVVAPAFVGTKGIVYILPDSEPLEKALPTFRAQPRVASLSQPGAEPAQQLPAVDASASAQADAGAPAQADAGGSPPADASASPQPNAEASASADAAPPEEAIATNRTRTR